MRVLFVYPNLNCQIGFNYGLAYISALLKQHRHETHLLNVNEKLGFPLDLERIRRETQEFDPDLVGFSVVSPQYDAARRIARHMKSWCDAPILCGGMHPTMAPEETLEDECWDYICVGEGEQAILDVVNRLERGESVNDVRNIGYRKNGEPTRNPVRPFQDLHALPQKDFDLFDFQRMIDAKDGWVGLMATRGCPFRCSYCFNHRMVDLYRRDTGLSGSDLNYIRRHPPEYVAREIEYLLDNYDNIDTFIFDDDILTLDKDYLRELCRLYSELTDIPFVCNSHVKVFDAERAEILADAGCRIVKFGLESGSERIRREVMKRRMSNEDIEDAFRTAHEAGLETAAFVMFGLPTETMDELDETVELLATIRPSRFRWSIFFPFPNTDAYDLSASGGFIDPDAMEDLSNFMEASCLDFGPAQNLRIRKLRRTIPWEVNVRTGYAPEAYREKLQEALEADEEEWKEMEERMPEMDGEISRSLLEQKRTHYAIKYNEFMAVKEPDKETLEAWAEEGDREDNETADDSCPAADGYSSVSG